MNMTVIDYRVTDFMKEVGVPVTVALLGALSAVAVAALSFALGRWGDDAARRRKGYAAAAKTLVAYAEYPWKIRRRTSDEPDELGRLAAAGHELQEALRYHQAWINSENHWVGRVYREVREDIALCAGPACSEAWRMPPVTTAAGMCLGEWGPRGLDAHIDRFEPAKAFRFGWRRILAIVHLHLGVTPREGCPKGDVPAGAPETRRNSPPSG
jgi:hypothetical protein